MKNKVIAITAICLLISIGNYTITISDGSVRTVEFLSILAIGALLGVLITQIIVSQKNKNKAA